MRGYGKRELFKGCTTDEQINYGLSRNVNLIKTIANEMQYEHEDTESTKLLELYQEANEDEKALLDFAMVCLTGNTMNSLIEEAIKSDFINR